MFSNNLYPAIIPIPLLLYFLPKPLSRILGVQFLPQIRMVLYIEARKSILVHFLYYRTHVTQ